MSSLEKDNEKNVTNQINSKRADQVQEDTRNVHTTVLSKRGSWLNIICSLLAFLIAPSLVMLVAYTIINLDGSVNRLVDLLSSQHPQDILQQIWWPYILGNYEVWTIIGIFVTFELLLIIVLPGYHYTGSVTPKGNVPHYKNNGLLAFSVTIIAFGILVYYDIFNPAILYENFMYLIGALNLFSLCTSLILFIKGKCLPSTSDVTDGLVYGFFQGVELHPRILGCGMKLLINSRFGVMGWALLLLSYISKQYQITGEISDSIAVAVSLQLLYIMKFFYWEQGYTGTLSIIHDRAGFFMVSVEHLMSSNCSKQNWYF